jgi:hypothetical protein
MFDVSRAVRTHEDLFLQRCNALIAWTVRLSHETALADG